MTLSSHPTSRTRWTALGGSVLIAIALTGCSSGGAESSTESSELSLRLGTVLPQTGSIAYIGAPSTAGVNLAIADIKAADSGLDVEVEHKDSGDTSTDIATQSVTALLNDGVSAIVGPVSSGVMKTVIDQIVQAGVVDVSPASTSPDFTDYEDDGYFWRTAPSDVLQGQILGNKILADGKTNVSLLSMNDAYGSGIRDNVIKTLEAGGAAVGADVVFEPGSTDFNSAITTVLATNPDALVVASFDEITVIAEQLAAKGFDFSKLYGPDGNYGIITEDDTNVDIAGAQFTNPGGRADVEVELRLQELVAAKGEAPLTVFNYANESYDATILLALAALQGGSTESADIRDNLQSVSEGGTICTTFADCAALIADGTDVDYDGLSGPITFSDKGDTTEASVSVNRDGTGNTREFEELVNGTLAE